jgi:hypothetical protein
MKNLAELTSGDLGGDGEEPVMSMPAGPEQAPLRLAEDEALVAVSPESNEPLICSDAQPIEAAAEHPSAMGMGALVDQLAGESVREIDRLIAALQVLRDQLYDDGHRVQRELNVLAQVGDSAMRTTLVVGKALGKWRSATERGE